MKTKMLFYNIIGMVFIAAANFITAKLWGNVQYSTLIPSTITVLCFCYILAQLFSLEKRVDTFLIRYKERSVHEYISTIYDESLDKLESLKKKEILVANPHLAQFEITRIVRSAKRSIHATHLPQESISSLQKKTYSWYDLQEWENANYHAAKKCKEGVSRIFIITQDITTDNNKFEILFDILSRHKENGINVLWVPITKLKQQFIYVKDYLIMDNMLVLENIGPGMANFRIVWEKDVVKDYILLYKSIKHQSVDFNKTTKKEDLLNEIREGSK